jgi:AraC-like DNA-binding protein
MDNELVVRSAQPGLRRHIHRYWGYAERTAGPTRQREPPTTGVILIFGLGTELRVLDRADTARPPVRLGSFVAGLDDGCALIEHDGEMRGVQVDLTPLAARMIFRVPMQALARQTMPIEDVLGRDAQRLEERLIEAGTWNERFDLIEAALGARLAAAEQPPPDVDWAWRRLTTAHGRVRIGELAAELGCSRKHLATRFREHVGLPPRLIARLLRFRHAVDELVSSPEATIAEVAAACGYYDHAHLDRDFQDFAATTPTAYVADPRERVTSVQDTAAAAS